MRREWALFAAHNCLFVCFPIHKQINLILFFVSKPLTNLGTFRALSNSSSSTLNVTPAAKGTPNNSLAFLFFPFLPQSSFFLFFSLQILTSRTNTIIALNLLERSLKKKTCSGRGRIQEKRGSGSYDFVGSGSPPCTGERRESECHPRVSFRTD